MSLGLYYVNNKWLLYISVSTLPGGSVVKNHLPINAGDEGLIPGSGRPLEKEMATHSSILTWGIPWTEEPGGYQSMALQRVAHSRSNLACMHVF